MTGERVFVDTNVLVYAHDKRAGRKHEYASAMVRTWWSSSVVPTISVQVLQEFYVVLLKKRISAVDASATVLNYASWDVVENTKALFSNALQEQARWGLSFWDAMILAAARQAKVKLIISEDFSKKQNYSGIEVKNPFAGV